jgi:hypothetical protein
LLLLAYPCCPVSSLNKQIWNHVTAQFYSKQTVTQLTCWLSFVSYLILLSEPYLLRVWLS